MRIHKMLIYCIKLDHALYSINYGMTKCVQNQPHIPNREHNIESPTKISTLDQE